MTKARRVIAPVAAPVAGPPVSPGAVDASRAASALSERIWRTWLGITLAAYLLLQVLYVTATPLQVIALPDNLPAGRTDKRLLVGLGPDEKEHFLYVLSLAEQNRLPAPDPARRTSPNAFVTYQAQHPPVFYALAALVVKAIAPLLGPRAVWYVLRGLCALCGAAVVTLAARAARVAFADRPLVALGAAPFVAFLPMFGHMTGNVSNEPLAMVFGAGAWLALVRLVRGQAPATMRAGASVGVLLGLAALTRLTALLWLPAAVVALGWVAAAAGQAKQEQRRWAPLGACLGCFALLALPWLARNELAFGTPFLRTFDRPLLTGGATLVDFFAGSAPPPAEFPVVITPRFTALWYASTSWLPFWLTQFYVPGGLRAAPAWQAVLLLTNVFALIALFLHASRVRRNENERPADPAGRAILWASGAAVGFCVLVLLQQQLYADWNVVLSAGRYSVAAVPASALLFLFALSTLSRGKKATTGVVAGAMFLLGLYCVLLVRQFYADNPRQPDVQRVKTVRPDPAGAGTVDDG